MGCLNLFSSVNIVQYEMECGLNYHVLKYESNLSSNIVNKEGNQNKYNAEPCFDSL